MRIKEIFAFHGHFSRFFHGDPIFFTGRNLKIFTEGNLIFTGKKNTGGRPFWSGKFKRDFLYKKIIKGFLFEIGLNEFIRDFLYTFLYRDCLTRSAGGLGRFRASSTD